MSRLDRLLRASLGACLAYTAFFAPWLIDIPSINLAVGLFGLMNIASASVGVCPGYLAAKVSTRRTPAPEPTDPEGSTEGPASDRLTASLRNKLMLCIVLPGLLATTVFGIVLHRFASELVLTELTLDAGALASLAAHRFEPVTSAPDAAANALPGPAAAAREAAAGLVLHDGTGRRVRHPWEKLPDPSVATDDLLRTVGAALNAFETRELGRWRTSTADLLWVSERVPDSDLWVTAVVDAQGYGKRLAVLFGPRVLTLVLIVLWLTLWGAIYNVRKYTQRMAADAAELRRRSLHDPLTGLLNRMGLDEMLRQRFPAPIADDQRVAFTVVDLTGFRSINDSFGHALADQLLGEVARRIRDAVPAGCEVIRMGGDTFGILCTGIGEPERVRVPLERLRAAVDSSYSIGTMRLALSCRLGIALAPGDTRDATELVRFADLALSRARRTRVAQCRYEPDEEIRSARRLTLMSALRRAIDNGELNLVYQPKISLADGALSGVEALVRWHDPEHGTVSPEEFVSLAERAGMIDALTRSVLSSVERQCAAWRSAGLHFPVAVNLSPLNLLDPTLPSLVERLIRDGALSGGLLELELTENAVMEDADLAMRRLGALRELGVTLSIDDFGSGQSSFAYLQRFPISNLKIDRQFVMASAGNAAEADTVLLRSMIDLGHNLGLVVTAEGVEDEASLERLRALGCDYAQGYHIGRPMDAAALKGWLDARTERGAKVA